MTGEEVAAIRTKLGLTRDGLAELVGKQPTAVRDWELERRHPDDSAVILLAMLRDDEGMAARLREAIRRLEQE